MALRLLVLGLLLALTNAQSYIPRPLARSSSSCPAGQTFVSIGDDNVDNTDVHTPTTSAAASFLLTTIFNNTAPSTTITQLSFGILDNYQITNVALVRLGLYQVSGTAMTRLGQTMEIMLYSTGATTIYADLIQPVTIQRGQYAIAIWSNTAIYTGLNDVLPGQTANSISMTYTSTSLPLTFTAGNIMGGRAVKMVGCSTGQDPWSGPSIRYYSFCFTGGFTTPAITSTTASSTVMATFNGVVAVDTALTGTNAQGTYYTVTAGNARYQTVTYPATSTAISAATTQAVRTLVAGGTFLQAGQRLYPSSAQGVDYYGISFMLPDSTQYILQYQNSTFEIMVVSPGSSMTIQFVTGSFRATQAPNPDVGFDTCSVTAPQYSADTFNCPAGQIPVKYGDDEAYDAVLTTNTATSYINANYLLMHRFTANIPGTTLYQLSWLVKSNTVTRVARIRLGLFTNNGATYSLVQQTQEIKLWGTTQDTLLKANLIQPVTLVADRNYSIGVIADSPIFTSYALYGRTPLIATSTFGQLANSGSGFRPSVTMPSTTTTVLPVAASGCTTQQTAKYSFCAAFVYASYNMVYNGVLTTVGAQTDEKGTFRPALECSNCQFNYTYTTSSLLPRIFPMTLHDYNLDGDNRLYVQGNGNSPVNEFGLQFVVQQGAAAGMAVQLRSVYDAFSETYMFKENTQGYSTSLVSFLNPILSTFTIAPYSDGQPVPSCPVPPKPANTISPLSVARQSCPNLVNDMADTFGDVDVGNYAQHVDGTLIEGGRVYTQRFTADSNAVVNQLAVGILQNADRPAAIQVRLGLYSQADNTLLGQTAELTINQAVPQLINMNLPSPINIQSGASYLIAILTSAPLEVAHTGVASSPSMLAAFTTSGLPATFASSGNAMSPSIAAYACVRATHSFCASFQYYTPDRDTVTYLYQGLIQTAPTTQTNANGVYYPIWAAAGRLISYRRGPLAAAQVSTLFAFSQRPNTAANLYTNPTNGRYLDSTGIIVQTNIGVDSNLQFNTSINKYDESFSFGSTLLESDLFHSNFTFSPLGDQYGIPNCGLGVLPSMIQDQPPRPVCEDGEEIVSYGSGDSFTLSSNGQGVNGLPANQIFLRQITTDGGKWSIISQMKFGLNTNPNTIATIRLGLYDNRMQFVAGTEDVTFYNTNDYIATGFFKEPVYLAPATVYYLALWNQNFLWAGFNAGSGPSMVAPLDNGVYNWPQQFVDTNPNSMRSIGGFGCTTNGPPTPGPSSSSSTGNPFVSSSRFSSSSSSSSPAVSSSARSSSSAPVAATSSPVVSSTVAPSSARPSSTAVPSSTAATSPTSAPSSTGVAPVPEPSSTTKSGLESGAIAGLVIGCVIGSNLILLFCIWCLCLGGAAGKNMQHKQLEESRVGGETNQDEIEMESNA